MSGNESPTYDVNTQSLFIPFKTAKLRLSNRIVMAPMTRGFSPNGIPGPDVADYYRRRAENGVGLIVTEGTLVNHPAAGASANLPNFHGAKALEGWKKVASAVHAAGGKIIPQLWHVGMTRPVGSEPNPQAMPIGPSGLGLSGEKISEPLAEREIAALVEAYAAAAADAKAIGFDGIELHGAHGYLIDQFFWEQTNRRTDRYGGDIVGRTRFAAEIIKACRQAVGPDFPIVLRFSQWKVGMYEARMFDTPEELGQFLAPLKEAGVDIFHCSTRRFWEPEFAGSDLNLAGWTKKLTGLPTITVGSIGLDAGFVGSSGADKAANADKAADAGRAAGEAGLAGLIGRLNKGEFDLVAVGRGLLSDPEWAVKVREGRFDDIALFTPEATKKLY